MAEVFEGKHGRIVMDDQYGPIVISTFVGQTDVDGAAWHEKMHLELLRKHSEGQRRVVSISDATQSQRPSAEARKFWAESVKRTSAVAKTMTLATFVVIDNPIIRGAITAIGWMSEEVRAVESFGTLAAAIKEGQARLSRAGFEVPQVSLPYAVPPEGAARAAR